MLYLKIEMKQLLSTLFSVFILATGCADTKKSNPEPVGDNRKHYNWLKKECDITIKLIEDSGYTKNASKLGRRHYCTEASQMRVRITGILDSNAPGANDF
jgi:hypothetical protein